METYMKARLDILIEAPFADLLSALLDRHDVSGYTVFSALQGRGGSATWARDGLITDVGQMRLFVCIVDSERRERVLSDVRDELAEHIGFVTASEVQVMRPSKFP